MKKSALLLALSLIGGLLNASYAAEPAANRRAEEEAARLLAPCPSLPSADREFCPAQQADFRESYLGAMAGDPAYMADLANSFTTAPDRPSPVGGLRPDRKEGCAWLVAEAAFSHSAAARHNIAVRIGFECVDFTYDAQLAIALRAADLISHIRSHPAVAPPPFKPGPGLITTVPND